MTICRRKLRFWVPDRDTLTRELDDLEDDIAKTWETASAEGLPAPSPETLYLFRDDFDQHLGRFRNITLSRLEVEEPNKPSLRAHCESNQDIRADLLRSKAYDQGMSKLVKKIEDWRDDGNEVFLVSHTQGQAHRLLKLLEPYNLNLDYRGAGFDPGCLDGSPVPGIRLYVGALSCGFRLLETRYIVITEEEIFGSRVRVAPRKRARGAILSSLTDLVEGEPVVHEDYGIGIFRGLQRREFQNVVGEVMLIQYRRR